MINRNSAALCLALGLGFVTTQAPAATVAEVLREAAERPQALQTVDVIVGGDRVISGNGSGLDSDALLGLNGPIAQTADVQVLRTFRHFPFIAIRTSADNAQAFSNQMLNARAWEAVVNTTFLDSSATAMNGGGFSGTPTAGRGTMVAVVDTGVDVSHPFLRGQVAAEACFSISGCPNGELTMFGSGAARPIGSHGTHVAGIVAGRGDRFSGVAPGARIVAIQAAFRIRTAAGKELVRFHDVDILAALDWIIDQKRGGRLPIVAVNLSLGGGIARLGPCGDHYHHIVTEILLAEGIIPVAAAGNSGERGGKDGLGSPACAPRIVSVGAVDKAGSVAPFSNSAPYLTVFAPGVDILSSVIDAPSGYARYPGTSMAAPHVAGAIAILRSVAPSMPVDAVIERLRSGPMVTDPGNGIQAPLLDLQAMLRDLGQGPKPGTAAPAGAAASGSPGTGVPGTTTQGGWKTIGN